MYVPSRSAIVNDGGAISMVATQWLVGMLCFLICTVSGAERLKDAVRTYRWFKDGEMISNEHIELLLLL